MTFRVEESDIGTMIVAEGYGGGHDNAGSLADFTIEFPVGVAEMYRLAAQLITAANRDRERQLASNPGLPGPFVIMPARKKTDAEVQAEAQRAAEKIAGAGTAADILSSIVNANDPASALRPWTPDRMRAWTVDLPDHDEVRRMFKGMTLDNLGGVTVMPAGPATLMIAVGDNDLMVQPIAVQGRVRLELRPLVRDAAPNPPPAPAPPDHSPVDYTAMSAGAMCTACGDDAGKWATAFMQCVQPNEAPDVSESVMLSWFAMAMQQARHELAISVENAQMEARDR